MPKAKATEAIIALMAGNRGPDLKHPDYGISADVFLDGEFRIDLELTFKRDAKYCCPEPECHLATYLPRFWTALREHFAHAGIESTFPIVLRVKGVVEPGALLYRGNTSLPYPSNGFEYDEEYREDAVTPDVEGRTVPPGFMGIWVTHGHDGIKERETTYLNGRIEGRVTIFDSNGQKLREGTKVNGQWHGTLRQWNSEGVLIDSTDWDHGTGVYRIYYTSGILAFEQQIRNGLRHGLLRKWNGQGVLTVAAYYEDGQIIGFEGPGDPR